MATWVALTRSNGTAVTNWTAEKEFANGVIKSVSVKTARAFARMIPMERAVSWSRQVETQLEREDLEDLLVLLLR